MTAEHVRGYAQHLFDRRDLDLTVWWGRYDSNLQAVPRVMARSEPRVVVARAEFLAEHPGP